MDEKMAQDGTQGDWQGSKIPRQQWMYRGEGEGVKTSGMEKERGNSPVVFPQGGQAQSTSQGGGGALLGTEHRRRRNLIYHCMGG